ncbi:MAG: hypothetical protein ACJA08_002555 [Cyclobacteriaceae bacterium]|jgi:hypothetical protein
MAHPNNKLLKDHYLAHNRYTQAEYLIDQKTYRYIMEYISEFRYSMHMIPDDEFVDCHKLIDDDTTANCRIKINELVFE